MTARRTQKTWLPYTVLVLAVAAAYINVYHNPFMLDDLGIILRNKGLQSWASLPRLLTGMTAENMGYIRPLQMLLYFFTFQLFGFSLAAFHALNVALHAANACLVYKLGRRLGFNPAAVFWAALLWAVHPMHAEAVTYISGTAEPLFTLLCLGGIYALLPEATPARIYKAGSFLIAALAAKESAVVFPALACATIFLTAPGRLRPATYARTWPLWLIAAMYASLVLLFYHVNPQLTLFDLANTEIMDGYVGNIVNRVLTALAMLPSYLALVVWPAMLHMDHAFVIFDTLLAPAVLGGLALVVAAAAQVLAGKGQRGLPLSWGLLWFFAAMSPNMGVLKPLQATFAEHWMYLPSIGLFLGVAETLARRGGAWAVRWKKTLTALGVVVVLALGLRTLVQNVIWSDQLLFYSNIIDSGTESGRARVHLSLYYMAKGEPEKAIPHALAAIEHPAPLPLSTLPELYVDLAMIYVGALPDNFENGTITPDSIRRALPLSPHVPEAEEALQQALRLNPQLTMAQQMLDMIHEFQQKSGRGRLKR